MTLEIEEKLQFSARTPDGSIDFDHDEFETRVGGGFNEHGIRKNTDDSGNLESVDVIYEAMEPGPPDRRNGVRITDDFLDKVAGKDYSPRPPHLMDHDTKNTFSRIGEVRDVWFSDRLGKLMLMTRTPNVEGSRNHQEAIARYTHDPPEIRDGSLGFGKNYEAEINDDGEPVMVDGKMREFSTVNFPGGYDNGGVNTEFAEAIDQFSGHGDDELDEVYSDWSNEVNMTASQLEKWSDHPCADTASKEPEDVRKRNLRLLRKDKSDWTDKDIEDAKRTISFISRMRGQRPDEPASGGKGTCPSEWAVSLLNWAYNPFDEMPDGNPNPEENSINVDNIEFNDPSDNDDNGENPVTFAVECETVEF